MDKLCFYLRPSADISIEHALVPANSPNAYSLINEEVSDSSSTYIVTSPVAGETVVQTSSFKMSGTKPSDAKRIYSAAVVAIPHSISTGLTKVIAIVNGRSFELSSIDLNDENYVSFGYTSQDFVDAISSYEVLPEISVSLTTSETREADVKVLNPSGITQVYIEVKYDIGVYRKVNSEWKNAIDAYRKINGVWTKIDNIYNIVGSRLHRMGHHQEYISSVAPTCTETGLTEGYRCSICGEFLVPQNIISATGHSYVHSGGYNICSTCNHIEGIGFVELKYHGTPTELSVARSQLSATTVGNYALFGGGTSNTWFATVDAYNTSLTRTTPTKLSVARNRLAATTVGNYALFGGGTSGSGSAQIIFATVDAYNTSLTRTTPAELSDAKQYLTATTVGNYALFGGGYVSSSSKSTIVDAYNTSLTKTTPTELSAGRYNLAATTVGNYALFGGGNGGGNTVDAYDTSLTRTTPTELSVARNQLAATTVGNYALFGGGNGSNTGNIVDAYDTSLTRTTPTELSGKREYLTATTVGNYALFGGGAIPSSSAT